MLTSATAAYPSKTNLKWLCDSFWQCGLHFFGCITALFFFFLVSPWHCIYRLPLHVLPVTVWLSSILDTERCRIQKNINSRLKQNTVLSHKVDEHLGGEMNLMSTFSHFKELSAQTQFSLCPRLQLFCFHNAVELLLKCFITECMMNRLKANVDLCWEKLQEIVFFTLFLVSLVFIQVLFFIFFVTYNIIIQTVNQPKGADWTNGITGISCWH